VEPSLHTLTIPADVLRRGFWLYVWNVILRDGRSFYYVGRTGDSSSPKAQSPFSRVSGHLGPNKHANALKNHLAQHKIDFDVCDRLELTTFGPIFEESSNPQDHNPKRDKTHALERDLCEAMRAAGYEVLNTVSCRKPSDKEAWERVRSALSEKFPRLRTRTSGV
jgi:hypothetical protein